MNIKHIEYFVEVARCNTISCASKNLFASESTINSGISKLEEELGYKLFQRSKKGMYLTKEGSLIFQQAEKILSYIGYWHSIAPGKNEKNLVKVIAPPIIRRMFLQNMLSIVFSKYDFPVEVYTENSKHVLKIIQENPDAIIFEPCEHKYLNELYEKCETQNLYCECMYHDTGYLYYNGNLSLPKEVKIEDMNTFNVVCYSKNSMYGLFDDYYKYFHKTIALPSSFEQWDLIKTNPDVVGIFTNLISIFNCEDFQGGKIKRSFFKNQNMLVDWMMIYSDENKHSREHAIVLDLIREEFSNF